jgi:hypothetical protein
VREEVKKIIAFWLEFGLSGGWCPSLIQKKAAQDPESERFAF